MEFFDLAELRLTQYRSAASAANALVLNLGAPGPPEGKIWNVIAMFYMPDVAETQVVCFEKYNTNNGFSGGLLNPVSMNLNPAHATGIEQGMSFILLPKEFVVIRRVAATVGSTMGAWMQFVEQDLPLYEYIEPQERKRLTHVATRFLRASSAGSASGTIPSRPVGGRGGPGRAEPV